MHVNDGTRTGSFAQIVDVLRRDHDCTGPVRLQCGQAPSLADQVFQAGGVQRLHGMVPLDHHGDSQFRVEGQEHVRLPA